MGMANAQHFSALHAQQRTREAQAAEKTKSAAQQQSNAEAWTAWFKRELMNENDFHQAIGEELGERDRLIRAVEAKNAALEKRVEKLEQMLATKTAVDAQVEEITKRLDARALARDAAKKGAKGEPGLRGERGEVGPRGEKGEPGKAAEPVYIKSWQLDRSGYRASPVYSDNHIGAPLEFKDFYLQFLSDRGEV